MSVTTVTATAGPDGVVRVSLPGWTAGEEVEVTARLKRVALTPEELGYSPGFFENTYGSIDDETFVAPPRPPLEPQPSWCDE